jgi:hypothetical protein
MNKKGKECKEVEDRRTKDKISNYKLKPKYIKRK